MKILLFCTLLHNVHTLTLVQSTIAVADTATATTHGNVPRALLKKGSKSNNKEGGSRAVNSATNNNNNNININNMNQPASLSTTMTFSPPVQAPSIYIAMQQQSDAPSQNSKIGKNNGSVKIGKKGAADDSSIQPSSGPSISITAPSFANTAKQTGSASPSTTITAQTSNHPSTSQPSHAPSLSKTTAPSGLVSAAPSNHPTFVPTDAPSTIPSWNPSDVFSLLPSNTPSVNPSMGPSSLRKTFVPSKVPTIASSMAPSGSTGAYTNVDMDDTQDPTLMPSYTDVAAGVEQHEENNTSDNTDAEETATIILSALGAVLCFIAGLVIARQRGWHEHVDVVRRWRDLTMVKNDTGADPDSAKFATHHNSDHLKIVRSHHASWDAEASLSQTSTSSLPPDQSNQTIPPIGIIGLKDIAEGDEENDDDDGDLSSVESSYSSALNINETFSGGGFDESSPRNQEGFERIWNENEHGAVSFDAETVVASGQRTTEGGVFMRMER